MPNQGGSKGAKKPSLRDLSREMPTADDLRVFLIGAEAENARSVALVLASFVENLLENAINFSFVQIGPRGKGMHAAIFRDQMAPLSSFSAKILLGFALGVYDDGFRRQLDRFRLIRNVFAHAMKPIDFDAPLVRTECMNLDPQCMILDRFEMGEADPKERYVGIGVMAANHLLDYSWHRLHQMSTGERALLSPFRRKSE